MYFGDGEDENSPEKAKDGPHKRFDYGEMAREDQETGGARKYYDVGEGLDTDVARVDVDVTEGGRTYTHVNVRYCIS